jgi:hypothetical protein
VLLQRSDGLGWLAGFRAADYALPYGIGRAGPIARAMRNVPIHGKRNTEMQLSARVAPRPGLDPGLWVIRVMIVVFPAWLSSPEVPFVLAAATAISARAARPLRYDPLRMRPA